MSEMEKFKFQAFSGMRLNREKTNRNLNRRHQSSSAPVGIKDQSLVGL
jgi:hypothetical protein